MQAHALKNRESSRSLTVPIFTSRSHSRRSYQPQPAVMKSLTKVGRLLLPSTLSSTVKPIRVLPRCVSHLTTHSGERRGSALERRGTPAGGGSSGSALERRDRGSSSSSSSSVGGRRREQDRAVALLTDPFSMVCASPVTSPLCVTTTGTMLIGSMHGRSEVLVVLLDVVYGGDLLMR